MRRISSNFILILLFGLSIAGRSIAQPVSSYASAVKKVMTAVVNIYTTDGVQRSGIAAGLLVQQKPRQQTLGSGVIVDQSGYVLTNYHVVRNARTVMLSLLGGRRFVAQVVGVDPETDLAVLKITVPPGHAITLGKSGKVEIGDVVLAIGNPFGLGQTVTQGIVSALGRNTIGLNSLEDYIQTDAAINPGNSGGALVNVNGELIGINTGIYSHSGGYQGVGFAIPIDNALNVMQQIIKTGKVVRGWLGVDVVSLYPAPGSQAVSGVLVEHVVDNSPAYKAGLQVNDVIVYAGKKKATTARGFQSIIAQKKPGADIMLAIIRHKKQQRVQVVLAPRPQRQQLLNQLHRQLYDSLATSRE